MRIQIVLREQLLKELFHLLYQHIDLLKEFDPDLPLVLGDKNRLEQVFINLLMNSGDAMEGMGRWLMRWETFTLGCLPTSQGDEWSHRLSHQRRALHNFDNPGVCRHRAVDRRLAFRCKAAGGWI